MGLSCTIYDDQNHNSNKQPWEEGETGSNAEEEGIGVPTKSSHQENDR